MAAVERLPFGRSSRSRARAFSLGLSSIRNLELPAIAAFLKTKAPAVEVLTLVQTSPELGYGAQYVTPRQASVALHAQLVHPLCTAPFRFSLSGPTGRVDPPTRLRVLELAPQMLTHLGGDAGAWRIVRSKGSRGWYVDSASGWVATPGQSGELGLGEDDSAVLRRDL